VTEEHDLYDDGLDLGELESEEHDTRAVLLQLSDQLDAARAMPLSASVMVNRDEFGALLREAIDLLPEELRQARYLLKERNEVLAHAEREAARIVEAARVRAERMVERTEVVREARRTAEEIVEDAERDASRIRHEAEDYVDRKLAAFEVVLDRTMQAVQKGRERLQIHVEPTAVVDTTADEEIPAFFDQDED
jgi:F0F1-type ATP synthase membrane subunit b/b'